MKKNTVVVIGSNSFSGSDFIDFLLEKTEYTVIGLSRSAEKSPVFLPYKRHKQPAFSFHRLDLNADMSGIVALLERNKPEYIVNFAAQSEVAPSWDHPDHWFETNVVALSRLGSYLKGASYLKKYVHISSPEVYGTCNGRVTEDAPMNPSTPYAASKAAADLYLATLVKNFRFPLVTIRSTNVYGAHQQLFKIIPRTVISVKKGKKVPLHGGGKAVKSYIHIRDISRGELAAMEKGKTGELYHLSPDRGVAVRDVVQMICTLMAVRFADVVDIVGERLGQDAAYVIDSTKARRSLGWKPAISLEQGIAAVIGWVEENWEEIRKMPMEYRHKK